MSTENIRRQMQHHLDNLTKPKGSLGKLEQYALRLAEIQGQVPPRITRKLVVVFAGDHGIVAEGVSLYPQVVTAQMVANFIAGGAAVNVLAAHCGFDVRIVDAGVATPIGADGPELIVRKAASGTRNFAWEPAMTRDQRERAIENGFQLAREVSREGYDLVAIGDMGIGNTTTAAAILAALGFSTDAVVDRGTGIDDSTLERKRRVVTGAVAKHGPFASAHEVVERVGGLEFATMMGFILGLKSRRIACLLDGFPVTAAAYLAFDEDPAIIDYCFAGHCSKVKGHRVALDAMGLEPIVDLGMRLGEGTGAVIGGFLVSLAAHAASEMASFDSAGVAQSETDETDF